MRTRTGNFMARRRILAGIASAAAASLLTGCGGSATASPTLLSIGSSVLPTATLGVAYSASLIATGGSNTGYTWIVISGALPLGLALSAAGVISGTPMVAGPLSFSVKVTDSLGSTATTSLAIGLNNPQVLLSGPTISVGISITNASAGTVGSDFIGFSLGKNIINARPYSLSAANSSLLNLFARVTPKPLHFPPAQVVFETVIRLMLAR